MEDAKIIGHCQVCGRQQAVLASGKMSQHGYTVAQGWFNGVCSGKRYSPIEVSRDALDVICAGIDDEVIALHNQARALEAGKIDPEFVSESRYEKDGGKYKNGGYVSYKVPFCYADKYQQDEARKSNVYALRSRASQGESHVIMMRNIAEKMHGKALGKVVKPVAPERIAVGEKRVFESGAVVAAYRVEGRRVYWRGESGKVGWIAPVSWRAMKKG